MHEKDGGPAFPHATQFQGEIDPPETDAGKGYFGFHAKEGFAGMTLRDYFAATSLAFWARANIGGWCGDLAAENADGIARHAYVLADAMLRAREAQ